MPPMICPRHRLIAVRTPYGWPLCLRCFAEALAHAEAMTSEAVIRRLQGRR